MAFYALNLFVVNIIKQNLVEDRRYILEYEILVVVRSEFETCDILNIHRRNMSNAAYLERDVGTRVSKYTGRVYGCKNPFSLTSQSIRVAQWQERREGWYFKRHRRL